MKKRNIDKDLANIPVSGELQDVYAYTKEDYDFFKAYIQSRDLEKAAEVAGWDKKQLNKKLGTGEIQAYLQELQADFRQELNLNNVRAAKITMDTHECIKELFDTARATKDLEAAARLAPSMVKIADTMLKATGYYDKNNEKQSTKVDIKILNMKNYSVEGPKVVIPDAE
jgi:hypothetical protein